MTKYLLAVYILFINTAYAQKSPFTLKGTVNLDTGTILLVPHYDTIYYPEKIVSEARIKKGKFEFSDSVSYAAPYILGIKDGNKWKYRSAKFFLDKGTQKVSCNIDRSNVAPDIKGEAMDEWAAFVERFKVNNERLHQLSVAISSLEGSPSDVLTRLKQEKDSLIHINELGLISYTKEHPSSFITLWEIIRILDHGYRPLFDSVYNNVSPQVRGSVTAQRFKSAIEKLRMTTKGSIFPQLPVFDMGGRKAVVPVAGSHRLTLIDFWYSGCHPCIRLFPGFKKLYDTYHGSGFEIIGISIDDREHEDEWKKIITEKGLNWPQYLDRGKLNVNKLRIERYPTNFLLDSKGAIIEQDVRPEQLEKLLKERLK